MVKSPPSLAAGVHCGAGADGALGDDGGDVVLAGLAHEPAQEGGLMPFSQPPGGPRFVLQPAKNQRADGKDRDPHPLWRPGAFEARRYARCRLARREACGNGSARRSHRGRAQRRDDDGRRHQRRGKARAVRRRNVTGLAGGGGHASMASFCTSGCGRPDQVATAAAGSIRPCRWCGRSLRRKGG